MKTIIILLACIACLVGCKDVLETKSDFKIGRIPIKIYDIDSCEYIGSVLGSYSDFLTHKGNCKNKIHNR